MKYVLKKKMLLHKFVCLCDYIIGNINIFSEIQTYKLNPLGLGGTIFGRGKNIIINYVWM